MADIPSEKTSDVTNGQASNVKIYVTRSTTSDMTNNIESGVISNVTNGMTSDMIS